MSSVKHTAEVVGINGEIIDVEIDLSPGLFSLSIVGLADKAINESRHHIAAAIKNSGAHNVIFSGPPGSCPNVQRQSLHIFNPIKYPQVDLCP